MTKAVFIVFSFTLILIGGSSAQTNSNRIKNLRSQLDSIGHDFITLHKMNESELETTLENIRDYIGNDQIYSEKELFSIHPSLTKGKYYHFSGILLQYLNENQALYESGDEVVLVITNDITLLGKSFYYHVKSLGSFQYETTSGATNIIPVIEPVSFLKRRKILGYNKYNTLFENLKNLYPKLFSNYCIPYEDQVEDYWYNFFLKNGKLPQFIIKSDFNKDGKNDIILLMKSIESNSGRLIFILSDKSQLNEFTYKIFEDLELENLFNYGIELTSQGILFVKYETSTELMTWDLQNKKIIRANVID